MKINRRHFIKATGLGMGAPSLGPGLSRGAAASGQASFVVRPPKMHLGLVTYNLAQDWDIPTIIKNCEAAQFEGVELRTSHAHKVEVNLSAGAAQGESRNDSPDSKVKLMAWAARSIINPDQAKLRKDIEATQEYIVLAQDVGATGVKVRPNGCPSQVPPGETLAQIGERAAGIGRLRPRPRPGHPAGSPRRRHCLPCSGIKTIIDVANHPSVGACWNSNHDDLDGEGWDHNFNLLKDKIFAVHMRDLCLEDYPLAQAAHPPQRDPVHGFLPGGDSGQSRPGAGDELLPRALAGLPGLAVTLPEGAYDTTTHCVARHGSHGLSHSAGAVAKASRPNVLLILTDDQGYGDFSCHGNPVLKTPNLDKLHAESVRFTDFHVAPMCTPTRGQLHERPRLPGQRRDEREQRPDVSSQANFPPWRTSSPPTAIAAALRQMASRRQLSLPSAGPRLPRGHLLPVLPHRQRAGLLEQRLLRRHLQP